MSLVNRRFIGISAVNSAAIEKHGKSIYLWGSNSPGLIPYLPDSIILDSPHKIDLRRIFTGQMEPKEPYRVIDVQLNDKLAYVLVEQDLPDTIESRLDEELDKMIEYKTVMILYSNSR